MKVVVVGAGIAGLATAWALAKRGHQVTVVEQATTVPNPLAASGDHHRIIRRAYGGADGYARAITEAYAAWDELWADLGACHYEQRGILLVAQHPGDSADVLRQGLERIGQPCARFSREAAAERWPFLEAAGIDHAALAAEGGVLMCRRIAAGLVAWFHRNGVDLEMGGRVRDIDTANGLVTTDTDGTFAGDAVVVAAGAWVLKLFPHLPGRLVTYRTALAYAEPPADLAAAWAAAPVILDIGGTADGYVVPPAGGAGMKFGTGLHRRVSAPDHGREPEAGEGAAILAHFAPPIARLADYRIGEIVTCAYTFTPDETFYGHREGRTWIVSACSGHGYKFGAAVGRRVAEAVESGDEAALLRWLRAE